MEIMTATIMPVIREKMAVASDFTINVFADIHEYLLSNAGPLALTPPLLARLPFPAA
jgi:hypothetical protein